MALHRVVYVPVIVRYTSLDVEYWKILSMAERKKIRYAQVRPREYAISTELLARAMLGKSSVLLLQPIHTTKVRFTYFQELTF